MDRNEPVNQTVSVTEAQEQWNTLVDAVARRQRRVVLEKNGRPVAAIISAADLERLRRYDAEREERFRIIDVMRAAFADVPDEELEREINKAFAEARAERRAERERTTRTA